MLIKSSFITSLLIASITLLNGQSIIPIDYDPKQLEGITTHVGGGSMHVIDKQKSFFNAGLTMLYLIDNKNGAVLKKFDEKALDNAYNNLLQNKYKGQYNRYDDYINLNTCQKHPYNYNWIIKISDNLYACDIVSTVEKSDTKEMIYKHAMLFINEEMELIDLFEIETYYDSPLIVSKGSPLLTSTLGTFFTDNYNFYVKIGPPVLDLECDYIHFRLEENTYSIVDELCIPGGTKLNYFPGRFFAPFKIGKDYYFNNGEKLIKTDSLFNIVFSKEYIEKNSTHKVQLVSNLVKYNENNLAGVRIDLKENGVAYFGTIFQSNLALTKVKDLKMYDLIDFKINSVQAFEGKLYALMYNRKKKEYFIDIIDLE